MIEATRKSKIIEERKRNSERKEGLKHERGEKLKTGRDHNRHKIRTARGCTGERKPERAGKRELKSMRSREKGGKREKKREEEIIV